MPNGEDKNWIRLCAAIDGFRARYELWPKTIHIGEREYRDLQWMFSKESFNRLIEKLRFVIIYSGMAAEDDEGRKYDYGMEGFSKMPPDISAREWLGVKPDSEEYQMYS